MPRTKTTKVVVRTTSKRRKRRYVPRPIPLAVSEYKLVRMKYSEETSLNVTSTPLHITYAANDISECRVGSAGTQAMGHDQWSTFYTNYTVLGSRIKVRYLGSGVTVLCAINKSVDGAVLTSNQQIREQKGCISTYQNYQQANDAVLRSNFSTKKMFSVADVKDNHELSAAFNASPTAKGYYDVYVGNAAGNDPATQWFIVDIEYIVMMRDVKQLPIS